MLEGGGQYGLITLQDAVTATGNGTALSIANKSDGARTVVGLQINGINSDTITWEANIDGTNWVAVQAKNLGTGVEATTATADGLYRFTCMGVLNFRARVSTYGSGTITVTALAVA